MTIRVFKGSYESIEKKSLFDKEYKWTTSLELLMDEIKVHFIDEERREKGCHDRFA